MNTPSKWLTRAGSLLIMLGFFLPAASCSAYSVKGPSLSLSTLAQEPSNQSFLYLVVLGALSTLIATFIPAANKKQEFWLRIGQAAGLGLGALAFLGTAISLSSQLSQLGMGLVPEIGFFALLLGYGLAGFGLFQGIVQGGRPAFQTPPPIRVPTPQAAPPVQLPPPAHASPRLELVQGRAPSLVQVRGENFLIGRSRSSDLVLPDAVASAKHVRLRYGQGAWFIQDQDSSNGTFVNGQRIKAQRLKDGDQIRMGETTYVFHV